jgi:hypothetical protein
MKSNSGNGSKNVNTNIFEKVSFHSRVKIVKMIKSFLRKTSKMF